VVEVPDLAGAAVRVCTADELPESVSGFIGHQQYRLATFEDLTARPAADSPRLAEF
jgi:hypothetical protein